MAMDLTDSETLPRIDCGDYNHVVGLALEYVPRNLLLRHGKRMALVATPDRDGKAITKSFNRSRQVIVLSELIFSMKTGANITHPDFRYLIYVVLREVAHVVKGHRSQSLDDLSPDEKDAEEAEAKGLAVRWFNAHAKSVEYPQSPITYDEIARGEKKTRAKKKKLKLILS
jgi:hypothetical protein